MKSNLDEHLMEENGRAFARAVLPAIDALAMNASARATAVNRTHRVVRERAKRLEAHRSRVRGLWIPLTICSGFLVMICYAVWTLLAGYDLTPIGVPDSSDQFLVLLLWFFPVSMALVTTVLFRRARKRSGGEAMQ